MGNLDKAFCHTDGNGITDSGEKQMRSQKELETAKKSYCSPNLSVIGTISDVTEQGVCNGKPRGTSDCSGRGSGLPDG
jgi:hypothetical protein